MKIHNAGKIVLTLGLCAVTVFAKNAAAANINVTVTASPGCAVGQCPDFTINSDCTLQDALDIAECNLEGDVITLGAGQYDASAAGANTFEYDPNDDPTENFPLTLIGAPNGGSVIDGGSDAQGMNLDTSFLSADDNADISVQGIVFQNGNGLGTSGGGLVVDTNDADINIDSCQFLDNQADVDGGGLSLDANDDGAIVVNSNLFLRNDSVSDGVGGGVNAQSFNGTITLTNNILAENTAPFNGGGAFVSGDAASLIVTNNTLFNNQTGDDGNGGGIYLQVDDSSVTLNIYNNIVYGNTAGVNGDGDDIFTCEEGATVGLFNNDFLEYVSGGLAGTCGGGPTINQGANIGVDPVFVDSATDDFHLQSTSPAIDTGDLNPPDGLPTPDFDGVTRPQGPLPDMGALEFQAIPTPSPTPSPTPVPPIVNNLFLSGDGILSCSMQANAGAYAGSIAASAMLLAGGLATLWMVRRRSR